MSEEIEISTNFGVMDLHEVARNLVEGVDDSEIEENERRIEFVERLAKGWGPTHAGLAVGYSPRQIRQLCADPEMGEIIDTINDYKNDTAEHSIYRNVIAGNVAAQKMWSVAKMSDRGWVEKKSLIVEGQVNLDVVHSVKEALRESVQTEDDIAALHEQFIELEPVDDD